MNKFMDVLNSIDSSPLTPGDIIKAIRKNFNITLDDLESLTGILKSNLSKIENSHVEIGVHVATKLAVALGIHPQSILFPNGQYKITEELKKIAKKSEKLRKQKIAS